VELRKDPITQSWVVVGQSDDVPDSGDACPLCSAFTSNSPVLLQIPASGTPQVLVVPHLQPLYRIEGEASRLPEGIYDRMRAVGAHEIIIESPDHTQWLGRLRDDEIERVLEAYASRILDLKRDSRFKYVTVFQNRGVAAGEEWTHPHSQVTAAMFVPRRILYELSSARAWFEKKERCVFCDIVRQEEKQGVRIVDVQGDYVAFCPYAPRVPFEVWLMRRQHNHLFEQPRPTSNRRNFAALLGRTLRRISQIAPTYHLVVHTAPNTQANIGEIAPYWNTIADDFHWHFEIMPIVDKRSKSYSIKEVYFTSLFPEQAAEQLRQLDSNI
jgi:UDPglucose--hexose-1-phosphate uridylyltransferase